MDLYKKNKTSTILIAAAILLFGTVIAWAILVVDFGTDNTVGQPCTLEAKICPDGSLLGREGPNCEFPDCPNQAASIKPTLI
jgi:hypothetical protein